MFYYYILLFFILRRRAFWTEQDRISQAKNNPKICHGLKCNVHLYIYTYMCVYLEMCFVVFSL